MNPIENMFNPELIQDFLLHNPEYAWIAVFVFAFLESMVITGSIVPSIVLFSICVYLFDQQILTLFSIAPIAMSGAHLGDIGGFLVGKFSGNKVLAIPFFRKRVSLITRATSAADRFGPLAIIIGRFMPAIRPIMPFFLGLTRLEFRKFYFADLLACSAWGTALALMLVGVQSLGFINTILIALVGVLSFIFISNKVTNK
ncbi:MAG: VTT domain-containing protein [Gammaproteobacteria bacterium]